MTSSGSIATRTVIEFQVHYGHSQSECKMIQDSELKDTMSRYRTFVKCRLFKESRESLEDDKKEEEKTWTQR